MKHPGTVFLIPNFHFDIVWDEDMKAMMRMSGIIFLKALELLDTDPAYRYTVDHVAFLEDFLHRYPDQWERVRAHVRSGRLELVGGMVAMMDCEIPDGEAFARQLLYGQRWLEKNLGKRARVGWFLDNYAFNAQLPQLLKQARIDQVEICMWWAPEQMERDVGRTELRWEGIDGTCLLCHIAMPNYTGPSLPGLSMRQKLRLPVDVARERETAEAAFADYFAKTYRLATGDEIMVHVGGDFRDPVAGLSRYVAWWNQAPERPEIRICTPSDFFGALGTRADDIPLFRGEFNPPIHTIYRPREELREFAETSGMLRPEAAGRFAEGYAETKTERKRLDRVFSHRIREAEQLSVIASLLGRASVQREIEGIYHPVQRYQHHDPFIGCVVPEAYPVMMAALNHAVARAEEIGDDALRFIGGAVDSLGDGQAVLVYNALSWARREVASIAVGYEPGEALDLQAYSSDGKPVPCQITGREDHPDGSIRRALLLFLAETPPIGHAVYFVRPLSLPVQAPSLRAPFASLTLENERYRLRLSAGGGLACLHEKAMGRDVFSEPGAELLLEEDLSCYCYIDATDRLWRQGDYPGTEIELLEAGPLRWRVRSSGYLKGLSYREDISVYESSPRVDFDLAMDIRSGEDLRARVRFPLVGRRDGLWLETPYGANHKGQEVVHAVNWVDCPGNEGAVAVLNEGITSHELVDDALYLTLWRGLSMLRECGGCLPRVSRGPLIEKGHQEYRFALYPHAGDWRRDGIARAGHEFNSPLKCLLVGKHAGSLPPAHSWFAVSPEGVILNVIKQAEDSGALVLRLYESRGEGALARLRVPAGFTRWGLTNLLEDPMPLAPLAGAELELPLRPFEIATIMLAA
jgi:alpha-mannosidase